MKFSKMIICTAAAAVLAVGSMTGCAEKGGQGSSETASGNVSSGDVSSENVSSENGQENKITQEKLEQLVSDNFYCMKYVFVLGTLPYEELTCTVGEDSLRKVTSEKFPDYKSLEDYTRSVYCKDEADRLLYNYPYDGVQKYIDRDGELYTDINYDGGKGYYVDTENYNVVITDDSKDGECLFTVETTIEEPAENPTKEAYNIEGTAVYENGNWVLKSMIS